MDRRSGSLPSPFKKIPAERFHALSYEQLIKNPEETIKQLCIFLDIPYLPAMLDFHSSKEAVTTASAGAMWINLQKPVIADNTGKFRKVFTDTDLEIFELIAGDVMQELSYPLFTNRQNVALISSESIEKYQLENEQLKKNLSNRQIITISKKTSAVSHYQSYQTAII
ncbi:sulfotransferase [Niabella ginsengisoli]|uniref:sulfotransferase n=1 Tax=Niabella ginsengisoli TaxID=522298 RepID=UPI0021D44E48|nr:sulfotransferase [Niabella ginsengisoli]